MKLLPDSVTVLPAYATAGTADAIEGLGLISNDIGFEASIDIGGLLKYSVIEHTPIS